MGRSSRAKLWKSRQMFIRRLYLKTAMPEQRESNAFVVFRSLQGQAFLARHSSNGNKLILVAAHA